MSTLTTYNGIQLVSPEPTALGGKAINDNFTALSTALKTVDPASTNNSTEGYSVGSRWINTTTGVEWLCTHATGAAVWVAMVPTLEQVSTAGGTSNQPVTLSSGLFLSGSNLNMNDGSGSGGDTLNMDGGTINNANYGKPADDPDWTGGPILSIDFINMSGTPYSSISMNGAALYMGGGQITQMRAENQASAPTSPNPGQMYFDTTDNHFYGWNGSEWKQLDN